MMDETERQKVDRMRDKAAKLKRLMESERKIGNSEAAETIAATLNRMLIEYDIAEASLDLTGVAEEPIISVTRMKPEVDGLSFYKRGPSNAWLETLAGVVADHNMCVVTVPAGGQFGIGFMGVKRHTDVAVYLFHVLSHAAYRMAGNARAEWSDNQRGPVTRSDARDFRNSWLAGFITRIHERLLAERREIIKQESTALVVIDKAKKRVQQAAGQLPKADAIEERKVTNYEGIVAGRKAADKLAINKGLQTGSTAKGLRALATHYMRKDQLEPRTLCGEPAPAAAHVTTILADVDCDRCNAKIAKGEFE